MFVVLSMTLLLLMHTVSCSENEVYELRVGSERTTNGIMNNKLYLHNGSLIILCSLVDLNNDSFEKSNVLVKEFTVLGYTPSVTLYNSTWRQLFNFPKYYIQADNHTVEWKLVIDRERINPDKVSGQWNVLVELVEGSGIFKSIASLLDIDAEAILHWDIGLSIDDMVIGDIAVNLSHTVITQSVCSPDVAVLFASCKAGVLYVGVTYDSFHLTSWYDFSHGLCQLNSQECSDINVVDSLLTNRHLLIVTTNGLYVSQRLNLYNSTRKLLGFTMITLPGINSQGKYVFSELSQRRMCRPDLRHKHEQDEHVTLVVTSATDPRNQNVFLSLPPFILWHTPVVDYNVISLLYDNERDTVIALKTSQDAGYCSVTVTECNHPMDICSPQHTAYQSFRFPEHFQPRGIILHPQHYAIYAFGSQVWLSLDGGNHFTRILSLSDNEMIVASTSNYYSDSIVFVSNKHRVFYGKAGLHRLSPVMSLVTHSSLVLDYLGNIYTISWSSIQSQHQVTLIDVHTYIEGYRMVNTTLAFHSINCKEVFLFEYDDKNSTSFSKVNSWQIITFGNGGKILIVSVENLSPHSVFKTLLRGFILTPLNYEKRITMNNIMLSPITGTKYNILFIGETELIWSGDDVGKTLVCPGCCSILITTFLNTTHMQGYSMSMSQSQSQYCYLYNLGDWYLSEDECQHIMIPDEVISTNPVIYLDLGDDRTFSVSAIKKGQVRSTTKSLNVMVGNAKLIRVASRTVFDSNGYETVHISVRNDMYITGISTVTVYLYQSSTHCQHTSFTVTVLCTCPPTKRLSFIYPFHISMEDYLHGNPTTSVNNRKLLYDLEVNYRPPSEYGIAIPTSVNVYNVDPSQDIPRNTYLMSKISWKYKQCAEKSSREDCSCTDEMKISNLAMYSDCKQRVYRVRQSESELKLKFKIILDDTEIILTEPYVITIEEINGRQDFYTENTATNSLNKIMENKTLINGTEYLNPTKIVIFMEGSGLYHFKGVFMKGFSYCQLEDEFQVFIDGAVLPYPLQLIIMVTMSFVIGGIIFAIYLWYLSTTHTHCIRKIGSRCQEIN